MPWFAPVIRTILVVALRDGDILAGLEVMMFVCQSCLRSCLDTELYLKVNQRKFCLHIHVHTWQDSNCP